MGEVIDFETGEPIQPRPLVRRDDTVELIESIYQRRNQVNSIVIGYFEERTGRFIYGWSYLEDGDLDRLQACLNRKINKELGDYGEELSFDDNSDLD